MNKSYLLGALLLSSVSAGKLSGTVGTAVTVENMPYGSYTYTVSGDCFSAGTATTLGMNNKFYQYYTFDVAAGTKAFAAATPVAPLTATTNPAHTYTYAACSHTHLYNWMAVPVLGTSAVQSGLGTAVVAYGYVLTGTAVTSCVNAAATGTLYTATTKAFSGAAYQSVTVTMTAKGSAAANTITQTARAKIGNENLDAVAVKAATITTYIITTIDGIATSSATNHYWDFM